MADENPVVPAAESGGEPAPQPAPPVAAPEVTEATPSADASASLPTAAAPQPVPEISETPEEVAEMAVENAKEKEASEPPASPNASQGGPEPPAAAPAASPVQSVSQLAQRPHFGAKMREAARIRRQERLQRILALVREKHVVTNNDVQLLLGVSDATATNYLRELIRTGFLRRSGAGRGVRYEQIG